MVSDLPVYRRNATSVTDRYGLKPKKGRICVAWVWNREGTAKLVNGKQHSVWFVPTGMKGLPQNVFLNFRLEFPKSDLTIYPPSGISEIFCQMVSTPAYLQLRYNTKLRTDSDMFRTRWHTSLFRKKSTEPKAFYLPTSQLIFLLLNKSLKNFHPQCTIAIKQRHRSRWQSKDDDDDDVNNNHPHDDGVRRPHPQDFESQGDEKSRSRRPPPPCSACLSGVYLRQSGVQI